MKTLQTLLKEDKQIKTLQILLDEDHLNACKEAITWIGDRTIEQSMIDIHRGDWCLFMGMLLGVNKKKLTLAKGKCAETVMHLMSDQRSVDAVKASIDYGNGLISKADLQIVAAAANKAANAAAIAAEDDVDESAAYAADAASYAANVSGYASDCAYASSYAADSETINQQQTADICKEILGQLIIDKVNGLYK